MNARFASLLLCFLAAGLSPALAADPLQGYADPGPHKVKSLSEIWKDESRDREVPVKMYYPAGVKDAPVIIFSHGLGGSRDNYVYIGRHWASHGFAVIHVQHHGSDIDVWKNKPLGQRRQALMAAIRDLNVILDRPDDITFALDQVERLSQDSRHPLGQVADAGNMAVAGHSFGAFTTLAVAGQNFSGPEGRVNFADPRLRAGIAMSPNKPLRRQEFDGVYKDVGIPLFHMTGTLDTSAITPQVKAEDRLVPYQRIQHPEQHLLVLEGGDHMVFSGFRWGKLGGKGDPAKDPRFHQLIKGSSTAFWKGYLQQDAAALGWLSTGPFARALGADGRYENKRAVKSTARN